LKVSAEIDLRGLNKALEAAIAVSSRSASEVINSAARDIIFTSAQRTKKADKQKIESELTRRIYFVTKGKSGRVLKKPKKLYQASELVYRLVNAKRRAKGQRGIAGQEMSQAAQTLIKRRMAAVGYIAYAGWNKALIAFGGRGFGTGKTGKIQENSYAARGYGRPAWPQTLNAEFANRATNAFEIGGAVTQSVVSEKEAAIYRHLESKLAGELKRL
jgi:hypothetical protein